MFNFYAIVGTSHSVQFTPIEVSAMFQSVGHFGVSFYSLRITRGAALAFMTFVQIPVAKALEAGLVDHVAASGTTDIVQAATTYAHRRLPQIAGGLTALRTRNRLLKVLSSHGLWFW